MKNRIIVWGLILVTAVIILPPASFASSEKTNSVTTFEYSASYSMQNRRGRRGRGRDDRWNRGRSVRRSHGTRVVKQTYYRNGRRYVRYVRVRY